MAAPAETRTPNLHRATNAHIECGWKGGVSLSSARKTGSGCERRTTFCFSLARQDSIRPAAATVKTLRYAPTAAAARPKRAVLTAVLARQNHATIRAREKQKVMNDPNHLTSTGLLMEVLFQFSSWPLHRRTFSASSWSVRVKIKPGFPF